MRRWRHIDSFLCRLCRHRRQLALPSTRYQNLKAPLHARPERDHVRSTRGRSIDYFPPISKGPPSSHNCHTRTAWYTVLIVCNAGIHSPQYPLLLSRLLLLYLQRSHAVRLSLEN